MSASSELRVEAASPERIHELARRTSMTLVPSPSDDRADSTASNLLVANDPLVDKEAVDKEIAYPGETEEAILRDETEDFPDGGFRAWLVVAGGSSLTVASFGYVNTWGVFQAYYEGNMLKDVSTSTISWIGSIQYSFNFFPGLIMGRLFDLGYFHVPLMIASTSILVITFLVAECTEYWQFLLGQGFALGLASGFMSGPTIAVVGHWFQKRRARAFGAVAAGSAIGGLAFPIVVSHLLPRVGFPWTMRILGFILMLFIIFANLTLRRRLPPVNVPGGLLNLKAFKNPAYSLYTAATFAAFMGLFTTLTYLNTDANLLGLSPSFAIYLTAIANGASGFGRISSGLLSDHFGPINVIMPFNLLTAVATFAWPFCTTVPSLVAIAIVYGFASGAYAGLSGAPLANMGEVGDMGRRIGMTFTISGIAALCGPPISGAIRDHYGSFHQVGFYAGGMIIISNILLLASKRAQMGSFFGKC